MPVGSLKERDVRLFSAWMWEQREETNFDMATLKAPRACIVKAGKGNNVSAYVPIQPVIFVESLCSNPDVTQFQLKAAVYEIFQQIKKIMDDSGHAETYFMTKNKQFADLCESCGWKKYMYDPEKHAWLMKLQVAREAANVT